VNRHFFINTNTPDIHDSGETIMKKILTRCTLLGLTLPLMHAACAQSSITIYGTADGGVRYLNNANTAGASKLYMGTNGWNSSNKLGFTGQEDLGGGLQAHFVLESGFNLATGALDNSNGLLFNRQSFVGLKGAWGNVDLGRQYTISHDLLLDYDPFGFNYTPLIPLTLASSGTRFSNDIKYTLQSGSLKLLVENAFGENAGSVHDGAARGVGLQYYGDHVTAGGSYNRRSVLVSGAYRNEDYYLAGVVFKLDRLRLSGGYMIDTIAMRGSAADTVTRNLFAGGRYRLSERISLTGGFYRTTVSPDKTDRRDMSIVGVDYFLSKRTKLYAEVDYTRYRAAVVSSLNTIGVTQQTGMTVGINHRF